MRQTRVRPTSCTACGYACDTVSSVDGDFGPRPGNFTICLKCGHLMAFDGLLRMRDLTGPEMVRIAGDRRVLAVQRARARYKKQMP